jgi:hypothetical protein
MGFLDYEGDEGGRIAMTFLPPNAVDKVIVASFGSPYFGEQYFEKAETYVNAYSMLDCSVRAFVRAACGEIPFEGKSPVELPERGRYAKMQEKANKN